jgi:hypothetical protein
MFITHTPKRVVANVCRTWFWVPVGGMGNAGEFVWDGDTPPPHGPPPCYGAPICLPGL